MILVWKLQLNSPPLITIGDWWSPGPPSPATVLVLSPFPCLDLPIPLLTAQSKGIRTLPSEEGDLYTIIRDHTTAMEQSVLLWCCRFYSLHCYFFPLPTRTQAGDSLWFLEDGVARKLFQHRHDNQAGGGWQGKWCAQPPSSPPVTPQCSETSHIHHREHIGVYMRDFCVCAKYISHRSFLCMQTTAWKRFIQFECTSFMGNHKQLRVLRSNSTFWNALIGLHLFLLKVR